MRKISVRFVGKNYKTSGNSLPAATNRIEAELTQCRVLLSVNPSPSKTWPKWALQRAQSISLQLDMGFGTRVTAPGKFSSNAGQPHCASNFAFDENNGELHRRQIKVPSTKKSSYSPLKGCSVPLFSITCFSSGVSGLYAISYLTLLLCYTENMTEVPRTPIQKHFTDVKTLHDAGIPVSPAELAAETGGQPEDLQGIHVVKPSPELTQLAKDREDRHLRMAGYSSTENGDPIGFARLLQDVRSVIERLKKIKP